jgi:uncharacterized protein (TIGR03382 family)
MRRLFVGLGLFLTATLGAARVAEACGCFVPPDPSVPVVQAGERILFSIESGKVTAHIQIQYAGNAEEFGWLLPLPSVPTLELGTDELFNQLITQTQPKYRLQRRFEGDCVFNRVARGPGGPAPTSAGSGGGAFEDASGGPTPLVLRDTIGPYDYAVLRADNKDAMLGWLDANRYFVPAGTDGAVGPYIRPGAYFLALKLRSGQSAGDLQPVVVHYSSDLPMIPIVLTSVAAQPNMGIQVWMLGAGRAIPRNYYHTVVNDALIDWGSAGQNYNDVIIRAVGEAPGKHSFVTEYAGSSTVMRNVLNAPGRFGSRAALEQEPDAVAFVNTLSWSGFSFTGQLLSILTRYIPVPPKMAERGITAATWIGSLSTFLSDDYRRRNPNDFEGWAGVNYQPVQMAAEIWERVVDPTLAAGALFDRLPYLTRLYTTLSPEDMNKDPVFSFNPALRDVPNVHQATLTYFCNVFNSADIRTTPAHLVTAQGFVVRYPYGTGAGTLVPAATLPFAAGIEILREEGPPEVVTDNTALIRRRLSPQSGCSAAGGESGGAGVVVVLLALGLALARRRA